MTREKKKVRSVAGQKFVSLKTEKKTSAAKAEYKTRKQENLAKKKRQKSLEEKRLEAERQAKSASGDNRKKRQPRLKRSPEEVAQKSAELMGKNDSEMTDQTD
ncbi:hypothetical protein [Motiliproteus sp. MSK22-1]|uniref:hypothetical protein n=1 Tax=Motiliproteus sp. MSK22-1 TaxID=1897630 RepID=UPI000976DEB9|nr:hypothetical protein [Motiliproteus sp. MSK22-1]OMH32637.1 hypothetical protein BGP75_13890 [Motiliproteus sp. MSK22-1]